MIIKELTIQGFKSFAHKTGFEFGSGVTAIVGPNGSGKSNVADAVRWALGEQSAKTLRVKKTDDLIFAGTKAKAKGSVAEVRVVFDNSDGAAPIDFTEIELSRKLYGSGESDYRLNGRKVRLAEVQQLLAAARIGVGSYAIIGQGTIDSLVLATPAERKLLFEEASGIRAFELRRAAATKRLVATEANMQRARDSLAELGPRLATLERTLDAVRQRDALGADLARLRQEYAIAIRRQTEAEAAVMGTRVDDLETRAHEVTAATKRLAAEQRAALAAQTAVESQHKTVLLQLRQAEAAREQLLNDISVRQAELQHLRERFEGAEALRSQRATLQQQSREWRTVETKLQRACEAAQQAQKVCINERDEIAASVRRLQQRLVQQRKELQEASGQEYLTHAHTMMNDLHHALQAEAVDWEQLQGLADRVRRLLKLATRTGQTEVFGEIRRLQTELGTAIRQREAVDERYTMATLELRRLELELVAHKKEQASQLARQTELAAAIRKAEQAQTHIAIRAKALAGLQTELEANQQQLEAYRSGLAGASRPSVDEAVRVAQQLQQYRGAGEQVKVELAEARRQLKRLQAALAKQPPAAARSGKTPTDSPEQLQHRIIQAEARLAALEEIGGDVAADHAEASERHRFVTTQLHDLEAAQTNLHTIISQLDTAIRSQFDVAFEEISTHFSGLFGRLFGGGSARLALQRDGDELGIEIEVTPPGKRLRHLSALSGGERSLAAIALLGAIIRVNPSPILLLDEVDAALDEANTGRFSALLSELAASSQVIVITHNRQTMLAAQALFGVTMDHEQVSRTVSVQLDEAEALASTARR